MGESDLSWLHEQGSDLIRDFAILPCQHWVDARLIITIDVAAEPRSGSQGSRMPEKSPLRFEGEMKITKAGDHQGHQASRGPRGNS